jgi:hypothetical protein
LLKNSFFCFSTQKKLVLPTETSPNGASLRAV